MAKNLSQQELEANESPEFILGRELQLLLTSKDAVVSGVSKTRLFVECLTKALTQLLVEQIEEDIPTLA